MSYIKPFVISYVIYSESILRISVEDALQEISGIRGNKPRDREISIENLFVELSSVRIFKREISTDQSE